jgi:hypothetical protein
MTVLRVTRRTWKHTTEHEVQSDYFMTDTEFRMGWKLDSSNLWTSNRMMRSSGWHFSVVSGRSRVNIQARTSANLTAVFHAFSLSLQANVRILLKISCPPQIPLGLTRAQTRASAASGRRLTAWGMARPSWHLFFFNIRIAFSTVRSYDENDSVFLAVFRCVSSILFANDRSWRPVGWDAQRTRVPSSTSCRKRPPRRNKLSVTWPPKCHKL